MFAVPSGVPEYQNVEVVIAAQIEIHLVTTILFVVGLIRLDIDRLEGATDVGECSRSPP